jgi:hypothetical protein
MASHDVVNNIWQPLGDGGSGTGAAPAFAAVAPMAADEPLDFLALIEKARKIAELASQAPAAPTLEPVEARSKLLAADSKWGAAVAPHGKQYYYDKATGHTQWDTPKELKGAGLKIVLGEPLLHPALPTPWRELRDGASGRQYYWDASTGVTQWARPLPPATPEGIILPPRTILPPW